MNYNPLIVALDFESAPQAMHLVDQLGDSIDFYKVGLELFIAAGHSILSPLLERDKKVFLDLKFHDIPATVERATAAAAQLGVHLLTVHAHPQVMAAAVQGRANSTLKILGVTVLTSLNQGDLVALGHPSGITPAALVEMRVQQGLAVGINGFVCSPLEVQRVAELSGPGILRVTPGVRSAGAEAGDQKRVATPAQALRDGATHLVIGRQITRSQDPRSAALALLSEISTV